MKYKLCIVEVSNQEHTKKSFLKTIMKTFLIRTKPQLPIQVSMYLDFSLCKTYKPYITFYNLV